MFEEFYHDWSTYETYLVAVWLKDDRTSQGYWQTEAARHFREASESSQLCRRNWSASAEAGLRLARQLKEEIVVSPFRHPSLCSDLLEAAFSMVRWQEIAQGMLADLSESEEKKPLDKTNTPDAPGCKSVSVYKSSVSGPNPIRAKVIRRKHFVCGSAPSPCQIIVVGVCTLAIATIPGRARLAVSYFALLPAGTTHSLSFSAASSRRLSALCNGILRPFPLRVSRSMNHKLRV